MRIFSDTASGALDERSELTRLLDHLRAGDTLVVWRLDRLGRSLRHLIDTPRPDAALLAGCAQSANGRRSSTSADLQYPLDGSRSAQQLKAV